MNSLRQKKCGAKMQGEETNWQDNRNRKLLLMQKQNENIACNKKAVRKTYFPCTLH
jgi:tmRNA-binding protein